MSKSNEKVLRIKKFDPSKAPMGFEPMTSCLQDRRSNQLSYGALHERERDFMDSRKKYLVATKENCVLFIIELLLKLRRVFCFVLFLFFCFFSLFGGNDCVSMSVSLLGFFLHSDQIRDKIGFIFFQTFDQLIAIVRSLIVMIL